MKFIPFSFSLGVMLAAYAVAAQPVASVTSNAPFYLGGNYVNVAGVPAWTVMAGNEISTESGVVFIQLRDSSRVTLGANSRAKIESNGQTVSVSLISGSLTVRSALPDFRLVVGGAPTTPSVGVPVSVGGRAGVSTGGSATPRAALVIRPISSR